MGPVPIAGGLILSWYVMWSGDKPPDKEETDEGEVGKGIFSRLLVSNFVDVVTLVKALRIITPVAAFPAGFNS